MSGIDYEAEFKKVSRERDDLRRQIEQQRYKFEEESTLLVSKLEEKYTSEIEKLKQDLHFKEEIIKSVLNIR